MSDSEQQRLDLARLTAQVRGVIRSEPDGFAEAAAVVDRRMPDSEAMAGRFTRLWMGVFRQMDRAPDIRSVKRARLALLLFWLATDPQAERMPRLCGLQSVPWGNPNDLDNRTRAFYWLTRLDYGGDEAALVLERVRRALVVVRAEYPTTDTSGEGVNTETEESVHTPAMSKEARALAVLSQHPDWSDREIAGAVGCSRTSLYRWPKFRAAREAGKQGRYDLPTGRKNADGNLEAW